MHERCTGCLHLDKLMNHWLLYIWDESGIIHIITQRLINNYKVIEQYFGCCNLQPS